MESSRASSAQRTPTQAYSKYDTSGGSGGVAVRLVLEMDTLQRDDRDVTVPVPYKNTGGSPAHTHLLYGDMRISRATVPIRRKLGFSKLHAGSCIRWLVMITSLQLAGYRSFRNSLSCNTPLRSFGIRAIIWLLQLGILHGLG